MRRYPFFDPLQTRSLGGLQLRPRHLADGQVVGGHRSRHRGFSVEFAEHRVYAPGDDLRYLDWKVYARTGKRYVRQFHDEREMACYVVIDSSASMAYRGAPPRLAKLAWSRQVAAGLGWLALHQRDAVGLLTFDQQLNWKCPLTRQPGQLDRWLSALDRLEARGRTAPGPALREMAARLRRRGLVIMLSDLWADLESLFGGLTRVQAAGHEVWLVHVVDPVELDFPFRGHLVFRGLEEEPPVVADAASLRRHYVDEFARMRRRIASLCRRRAIRYQLARTDSDPWEALRSLVADPQ